MCSVFLKNFAPTIVRIKDTAMNYFNIFSHAFEVGK